MSMRLFMYLLCAFILISPLIAQAAGEPLSDEEEDILGEGYQLLFEQYLMGEYPPEEEYIFDDEPFLSGESPPDGEPLPGEESFPGEKPVLSEESLPDDEPLLNAEPFPDDKLLLSEEPPTGDAHLSGEESLTGEEPVLSEESLPHDEPLFNEESPPDDELALSEEGLDSLFFEAPGLVFEVPTFIYETRSFDSIFPGFSRRQRRMVFSDEGLKYSFEKDSSPMLIPASDSGIDLLSSVMEKKPSHIIEALVVVPYTQRELNMLDVYNALGSIESLKDHTVEINGQDFTIFTETTRLESDKNRKPIADPPPADTLPYAETMYLRFKETTLGNLFLRGDITMSLYGITYSMTNFTDVRYFLIPLMKAERFSAIIYLEPVKEGVLVYSISGFYLPGFIADRVNLTPSINRRITVLIDWITEGLRRQEKEALGHKNGS